MQKTTESKQGQSGVAMSEVMTVNADQFKGLMSSGAPFVLIDLREESSRPVINRARKMGSAEAVNHVQTNKMDLAQPIVILCDDGDVSMKVAEELDERGYINVVVLEGGNKVIANEIML